MKLIAAALVLAGTFTVTAAASAQNCPAQNPRRLTAGLKAAGVAPDAAKKLQEERAKEAEGRKAIMTRLHAKRGEMHATLSAADLDAAKLDSLGAEMTALKSELFKSHLGYMKALATQLTGPQRTKFFTFMKKSRGMGMGMGCACGAGGPGRGMGPGKGMGPGRGMGPGKGMGPCKGAGPCKGMGLGRDAD